MKENSVNKDYLFAEQTYLSTVLMFPEHFLVNRDLLIPLEWITVEGLKNIYEICLELISKNNVPDLPIILAIAKERKKERIYYEVPSAADLTSQHASIVNVNSYILVLKEFRALRYIYRITSGNIGSKGTHQERIIKMRNLCNEAIQELSTSKVLSFKDNADNYKKSLETQMATIHDNTFCKSGMVSLDEILVGLYPGMLYICAGRPGMGKTAFASTIINNIAFKQRKKVLFFSIEMSFDEIIGRMASFRTEIDGIKIKKKNLEKGELAAINNEIDFMINANTLEIDDTPSLDIEELKAKAIAAKAKLNVELVVIDYLQIIKTSFKGKTREQEITYISNELKALSKTIKCPVIALAQLSRDTEKRGGNKKPMLSDLRESGSIEQDADVVMFLYRPEYYGIIKDGEGNDIRGKAEIIIAKHRGGGLGSAFVNYKKEYTKFSDEQQEQVENLFGEDLQGSQENLF